MDCLQMLKCTRLALVLILPLSSPAWAQSGGRYDARRHVVAGGGALSAGRWATVGGTAGQADAGTLAGVRYAMRGGFWGAVLAATVVLAVLTPWSEHLRHSAPSHHHSPSTDSSGPSG